MVARFTAIIAIMAFVQACGPKSSELDTKKEELKGKESQLQTLKAEIKDLEKEIEDLDTTVKEVKRTLVVVKKPERKLFKHWIQIPGRADSKQNILVSAEAMGNITKVRVEEGQMVSKGQVIAYIESDAMRNQVAELKTRLELATELYNKQKRLWDQKIGSEVQYLQAKNNKDALEKSIASMQSQLKNSSILAPISGYVDDVIVREGQLVSPGSPAARIVDLKKIRLEVGVSERYIGDFKKGDVAKIHFPSVDKTIEAPISSIGQVVSQDDRTFRVEIEFNNEGDMIKPNVLADVKIATYQNESAIVLPTSVIQQGKKGDYVFVAVTENGEHSAKKVAVVPGMSYNGTTEVLEGLKVGDGVITLGGRNIADGEPIRF